MNRDEWLKARRKFLGASDSAVACGVSPFKSRYQLWLEKTGRAIPEDISSKACVQFGIQAEPKVRDLFQVMHPELKVDYRGAFDMVSHPTYKWYVSTLDGRLESSTGIKGILEIKTSTIANAKALEQWDGKVPEYYLYQVLHQLNSCQEAKFVVLFALLKTQQENEVGSLREYWFTRSHYRDELGWLLQQEKEFWKYVETDKQPPFDIT